MLFHGKFLSLWEILLIFLKERSNTQQTHRQSMTLTLQQKIIYVLGALLLMGASVLSFDLVQKLNLNKQNKTDLAEVDHVQYGLLNVEEWSLIISNIVLKKVDEFELNDQNREEVQRSVEKLLDAIIVEVEQMIRERNQVPKEEGLFKRLFGAAKQLVVDSVINFDKLRADVPRFTMIILEELNQPETKEALKQYLVKKIEEFSESTFNPADFSKFNAVLERHGCFDKANCQQVLSEEIEALSNEIVTKTIIVLLLFVALFIILLVERKTFHPYPMAILLVACLVLLLGGITTPMLEVEAKINTLSFQLVGEPVAFHNQVLYFQSKSIVDVVAILVETGEIEMIFVGFLIGMFSIIFPALKLGASLLYYYNIKGGQNHRLIQFFALKSGKWSMADVMVIALFLTFMGFRSLISNQLAHLAQVSSDLQVVPNEGGTSLQAGFFLFLSFCLASLVFSTLLEKKSNALKK